MTAVRELHTDPLASFEIPDALRAPGPIELTHGSRDMVRLMVGDGHGLVHRQFVDLARSLRPGDLVVVNNSATVPAAVVVDDSLAVHFSNTQPGGYVVVEPRRPIAHWSVRPETTPVPGLIRLPGGAEVELVAPYPVGASSGRLWLATFSHDLGLSDYLEQAGRPIRYEHVDKGYPLSDYQTIFASVPGSAEMPGAGRPFSGRVLASLASAGVPVVPITLHTGVSSLESGEPPYPEWSNIPTSTARTINEVRNSGGRVIAVGTTVVRALESAADGRGEVHPFHGWIDLVVTSDHRMMAVDGMITGWHEPESTHLAMLEAVAGPHRLREMYAEALSEGYLWHEFGDSMLLMPG